MSIRSMWTINELILKIKRDGIIDYSIKIAGL